MKMKKMLAMAVVGVLTVGTLGAAFAVNPSEVYAKVANVTVEDAYKARVENGGSFGDLAQANGYYEVFKAEMLAAKKAEIQALVTEGKITQEKADEIIAALSSCDGTKKNVMRDALGYGQRDGEGRGQGMGQGMGRGQMKGGRR